MTAPKSWEQYKEELTPLAKNHNIQILGYVGEWKGSKTKLKLSCPDHGEWESTTIAKFKTKGSKCCPDCNGRRKVTEEKECISLVDIAKERGFTFIGLAEEWRGVRTKIRIVCPKHGEWNTTHIIDFRNGRGCPICSGKKPLTWETELPILAEIAQKKGYQVLGYVGKWKGCYTKLDLLCHCGNRWDTTSINSFKNGNGCPLCRRENIRKAKTISDDQHIADFFSTGKFKEGTIFTNTGKRSCSKSGDIIWMIECPVCSHDEYVQAGVCDGKFYSRGSDLKQGSIPCRCATSYHYTENQITYKVRKEIEKKGYVWVDWITKPSSIGKFKYLCLVHGEQIGSARNLLTQGCGCSQCAGHSQQQLYINIVKDNDITVALKFGIAKDSDRRLNSQNSRNLFFMERICLYDFSTVKQCKAAERAIKKKLKTGILTARELKDGYTETVSVSDLENLQKIITQYGGKLVYSKEM
ncbi:hypothetical protein bas60_0110 [Escherichia phage PaulScherrer]|nr:hypothetical protein bas60_0110 [Escherichia phage PaulScherrer]